MERLLSTKEAKRILEVSTKTIQRWDKEKRIQVSRTDGGAGTNLAPAIAIIEITF